MVIVVHSQVLNNVSGCLIKPRIVYLNACSERCAQLLAAAFPWRYKEGWCSILIKDLWLYGYISVCFFFCMSEVQSC